MGYLVAVLFIALVGAGVWKVFQTLAAHSVSNAGRAVTSTIKTGAAYGTPVLVLFVTLWTMAYQVPTGHVGIVYTFGGITGQRSEGLQWVAPWQDLHNASIQVQGHKFDKLDSFSSETQDVYVAATINVQVSPENIQALYREVGPNYFDVLIRPRVLQAFKDETVKYASVDIAPHREQIRKVVRERLTNELSAHSIAVQDLLMDNLSFRPEFQAAIEKKQGNTQLALAEREMVVAKRHQADQAIEEARGRAESILVEATRQAEANRKLAESITPEYIQYIFANRLSPNVSVMLIPSGQQFILGPDMLKKKTTPNMAQ